MIRTTRTAVLWAALVLVLGGRGAVAQQSGADSALHRLTVSRDTLQVFLTELDSILQDSAGMKSSDRVRTRTTAQLIRARLDRGDFQAGDRITLQVDSEPALSDTFPVGPNQELVLPVVGVLSLNGVLRSELQTAMARELGRFLRDPIVRATPLIRVSVIGEVNKPGFYLVPPTAVVSDVVTAAAGPTQNARVEKMWIERAGRRYIEGQPLQQIMADGRTLDDANIRPGDKFVVPPQNQGNFFNTVRTISIILSIPLTIYALTPVFKK
jgi:protein involved in polysaccharide export with SLBB domain